MNAMADSKLTGGCQCGAVRYEWAEGPKYASVCHCRMCQKASGQPFMALTGGKLRKFALDARGACRSSTARSRASAGSAAPAARR